MSWADGRRHSVRVCLVVGRNGEGVEGGSWGVGAGCRAVGTEWVLSTVPRTAVGRAWSAS